MPWGVNSVWYADRQGGGCGSVPESGRRIFYPCDGSVRIEENYNFRSNSFSVAERDRRRNPTGRGAKRSGTSGRRKKTSAADTKRRTDSSEKSRRREKAGRTSGSHGISASTETESKTSGEEDAWTSCGPTGYRKSTDRTAGIELCGKYRQLQL